MIPQRHPVSYAERLRLRHERVRSSAPERTVVAEQGIDVDAACAPETEDEANANRFAGFMGCAP